MMEPLGHPRLPERERVMARVTVQEGDVEARLTSRSGWAAPNRSAACPERRVECETWPHIVDTHRDVPKAHPGGDSRRSAAPA